MKKGLVCSLTNELADFTGTCENYVEDPELKAKVHESNISEDVGHHRDGALIFLIIGLLSIGTSLLYYFATGAVFFAIGLSTTQIFEAAYTLQTGGLDVISTAVSVFIASVFLIIWYFARKGSKLAFILGIVFYSIDTILMLLTFSLLGSAIHIIALGLMIRGYRSMVALKKKYPMGY